MKRPFHVLGAGIHERRRNRAAGVVDQDVQPAELGRGSRDGGLELPELEGVGRDDKRPAAALDDLRRDRFEVRNRPGGERDVRARIGERERDRGADAFAGAGHQRDLAVEAEPIEHRHRAELIHDAPGAAHVGARAPAARQRAFTSKTTVARTVGKLPVIRNIASK